MIGIYGGTFDPIHFGHLRPGLEVYQALSLSQVRFIPCGEPPHRQPPRASALQRLMMVRAAIAGQAGFIADDREIRRQGPSYMIDTLAELRREFATTPLCLIIGLDAFAGLESWHKWSQLFDYAHIVVTHRPGWSRATLPQDSQLARLVQEREADISVLSRHAAGRIIFQPVTQLDISSTGIRQMIAAGESVRYLLPETVYELIRTQQFYG